MGMPRSLLLRRILYGMLAGIVCGIGISETTYYFLRDGESRAPAVIEIAIPAGTAEHVQRGEPEPSLPASMTFVVGDNLVVYNQDSSTHQLGPLLIPAGTSASLKLDSEQDTAASCSFQPGKYFGLKVLPQLTLGTRVAGILQAGIPLGLLFVLYGAFAIPAKKTASV